MTSRSQIAASSSIFPEWTPLPQRKLFSTNYTFSPEKANDLYPNCDVSVWLRSCAQEIIQPLNGINSGHIPDWLNGCLLRNGPGSLNVADYSFKHLFDSSALLHRFEINNGKVTYQCRFLQSEVYKKNQAAKRIVVSEFGTAAIPDPCQSIFQRVSSAFTSSDNAMISVYPFGDEIFAFTETPVIYRINKITLETETCVKLNKFFSIISHTSHPHISQNGTVYNLGLSVTLTGLKHIIVEYPNIKNKMFDFATIVASVPIRWCLNPSYMHTFGITENYFIIVEQPLSVSIPSVFIHKLKNMPLIGNFKWFNEEMTEIHVINRSTGRSDLKFYSKAFFYLHIINQYEISNHIIIDICCYRDPSMLDCMYVDVMKNMQKNPDYAKMFKGRPLRFVLPLVIKNNAQENLVTLPNTSARATLLPNGNIFVEPEVICDLGCETPRINYDKYSGRKYRYFYAISSDVDAEIPGTIIKVDTETKSTKTWSEVNCYPSEPIFVDSPHSKSEDEGVILSSLVWGGTETNKTGLLILDAITFKEIGRSVFKTPSEVPKCLHGWFCKV